MRLTPWFLPVALSVALMATASYAFADENNEGEQDQHAPLDDQALEKEYGIKAGSVKRDQETLASHAEEATKQASAREDAQDQSEEAATRAGEDDVELAPGNSEERSPKAGTGGTGSPEDAIHSSEEENSDDSESDSTDDSE